MMRSPLSARSALYAMLAALPLLLLWPALRHMIEGLSLIHISEPTRPY